VKCSLLVLSSYLDGELEARREGELEAHLVGCQRCRAGVGYLREEVERVGALGRVHVADHSVHALLVQLGLIDADEALPETAPATQAPAWMGGDDATSLPWADPAHELEPSVDMTGTASRGSLPTMPHPDLLTPLPPQPPTEPFGFAAEARQAPEPAASPATPPEPDADRPWFRWLPEESPPEPPADAAAIAAAADDLATVYEPPSPTPRAADAASAANEDGMAAAPLKGDTGLPATPLAPPPTIPHGPPPLDLAPDHAPSALPSGGAFPPGGPERIEPSDSPTHDTAPGGEPEMTASPPWSPHDTTTGPLYPMTDDDVLGSALPVERFGPPPQASRPGLLERLRDRFAVRRALSRSSSAYEDQVQIVSGLGAPLRPGRARLEVERRRQETLHMDPGGIPGEAVAGAGRRHDPDMDFDSDAADDLGLGPLPPSLSPQPSHMPMPRPPSRSPGQMALPGTSVTDPFNPGSADPRAPIHRVPMPPPRHTIGSVLGDVPEPHLPLPPAAPPPPPAPDPLGEALSGFDRDRDLGTAYEPRPWRPRELAEDHLGAAPPRRFGAPAPETADRHRHSPSQLRDGRRLLAIFGAATLLMFIVGVVSGRTTSPRPTGATSPTTSAPPPATAPKASHSASSSSSAPGVNRVLPSAQPSLSGSTPQLTSVKVLGDSGTGYQVKDFRYGIHPGDFRIVLDLDASGAASGTPKATIGLLDPTTLYVVLTGVVSAGSTGQLPSSNPVTGVTLLPQSPFPGAITYQIKLAHPVQFSAGYVSSPAPLRLVLDIAS